MDKKDLKDEKLLYNVRETVLVCTIFAYLKSYLSSILSD